MYLNKAFLVRQQVVVNRYKLANITSKCPVQETTNTIQQHNAFTTLTYPSCHYINESNPHKQIYFQSEKKSFKINKKFYIMIDNKWV